MGGDRGARRTADGPSCKLRLDRDDDMAMTGKRHDVRIDYEVGFDETGLIHGYDVAYAARCGYSADLSLGICDRTLFHADNAYFLDDVRVRSRRMKTHTVSNTAFRGLRRPAGHGRHRARHGPHRLVARPRSARCAQAQSLRTGPRATRRYGQEVIDNVAPALIEALERTSDYRERRARHRGLQPRAAPS